MKVCSICEIEQPVENYHKKRIINGVQKYRGECKTCRNKKQKTEQVIIRSQRKINTGLTQGYKQKSDKNYNLKYNYGITLETYNIMLEAQNGVCAICGGVNKNGKPLFVDHCHETGYVRQLLCHHCNSGLGMFKDNPELLNLASIYLMRHK